MGPLLLFLTTFIWGTAFLAQKLGADHLGPLAITCFRNLLGGLFLVLCIGVRELCGTGKRGAGDGGGFRRSVFAGVCCGVPLFAAMTAQQIGIQYTSPGVSAFLTTNYVLFVPLLGAALTRTLPRARVWACAFAALAGTYLICLTGASAGEGFTSAGKGELWTILCAFLFSVQMLAVDRFAARCDLLVMSATQLFACAVCAAPFLLLESEASRLTWSAVSEGWWPVFYCGVLSSGVAYTLQNYGQAHTSASLAAVILSMESVFGALAGYVALGDVLVGPQLAGCALVFAAAVAVQLRGGREAA